MADRPAWLEAPSAACISCHTRRQNRLQQAARASGCEISISRSRAPNLIVQQLHVAPQGCSSLRCNVEGIPTASCQLGQLAQGGLGRGWWLAGLEDIWPLCLGRVHLAIAASRSLRTTQRCSRKAQPAAASAGALRWAPSMGATAAAFTS